MLNNDNNLFDIVLLLALPASGKSEIRHFLANVEAERLQKEFHFGATLQLDDFPYVHFMRRIDQECDKLGQKESIFHQMMLQCTMLVIMQCFYVT